jgi:hypothetical protein
MFSTVKMAAFKCRNNDPIIEQKMALVELATQLGSGPINSLKAEMAG